MRRALWTMLTLATVAPVPTMAQTQLWSSSPTTGVWSAPPATPRAPATQGDSSGQTQPWATAPVTRRRSDAEIQQQVDGIVRDVERRTSGMGAGGAASGQSGASVPDRAWRSHMDRTRAAEEVRRDQERYNAQQRYFRGN